MKLTLAQTAWLLAAVVLIGLLLLDVVGALDMPSIYWMGPTGLLVVTGRVMPTLRELGEVHRRG